MAAASAWQLVAFLLNLGGAVVCAVVAAWLLKRNDAVRRERGMVIFALAVTAAWCVANAAYGPGAVLASLIESVRNFSWILVLYRLFGNDGRDHSLAPIRPLVIVLGCVECLQPAIGVLDLRVGHAPAAHEAVFTLSVVLRALVAIGALVLVHNLYAGASAASRQVLRWPASASRTAGASTAMNRATATAAARLPPARA